MSRQFDIGAAPHMPPPATVGGVMRQVLYAPVPGILAHACFFGRGIFILIALASAFAASLGRSSWSWTVSSSARISAASSSRPRA